MDVCSESAVITDPFVHAHTMTHNVCWAGPGDHSGTVPLTISTQRKICVCVFVCIPKEQVMTAKQLQKKKKKFCLLIFTQIICSLTGSIFVVMLSWGPKHDSHPK